MKRDRLISLLNNILSLLLKLIISGLICFFLAQLIPSSHYYDQLEQASEELSMNDPRGWEAAKKEFLEEKGLLDPLFYFSVHPRYMPEEILEINDLGLRKHIKSVVAQTRNKDNSIRYLKQLNSWKSSILDLPSSRKSTLLLNSWQAIISAELLSDISIRMTGLKKSSTEHGLDFRVFELKKASPSLLHGFPIVKWHGSRNQFHQWIMSYYSGSWGKSLVDGEKVWSKIKAALGWTFSIGFIALLFALIIALFTGLFSGEKPNGKLAKFSYWLSLIIFASPIFWLATLFIQWFTTGGIFAFFSSIVRPIEDLNSFEILRHYFLPIFCLSLGIWAFLHQQLSDKVKETNIKPFILSARFYKIKEATIRWKYLLPNAAFPLISSLALIVPTILSGSLAIELIFDIPGIGKLLYESILNKDWNTVFPLVYFNIIIVIIANNLAEITYQFVDPRLRSSLSNNI